MKSFNYIVLLSFCLITTGAFSQVSKSKHEGNSYYVSESEIKNDCSCLGLAKIIKLKKYGTAKSASYYNNKIDSCIENSSGYRDSIRVKTTYKKRNIFGGVRYSLTRHEYITPMQLAIAYGDIEIADKIYQKTDKIDQFYLRSRISNDSLYYRVNILDIVSDDDKSSKEWLMTHGALEDSIRRKITSDTYSYTLFYDNRVIEKSRYISNLPNVDSLLKGQGGKALHFKIDALRYALKYDIERVFKFIIDSSAFEKDSVFIDEQTHGGGIRRRGGRIFSIPVRSRSYTTRNIRTWNSELLSDYRYLNVKTTFYLLEGEWFTIDELKKFINEKLRTPAQMYKPDKGDRLRYKINLSHHKYFKTYFQLISDEINLNKKKTLTKKLVRLDRKHQELVQLIKL